MRILPSAPRAACSWRTTASSAGSRWAAAKNGTSPSARQPVRSLTVFMPSSNRRGIAAEAIDDEAHDHRGVGRLDHRLGADQAGDDAAAVDVAQQHDRDVGRPRKAHVGDVVGAQIDLGGRACAFDQHEVALPGQVLEAFEHRAHELGLHRLVVAGLGVAENLALHHDLRADIALGLQQHGVHVHARRHPRGARLQRLGAADLAAVGGDRGIVRHVLRLERAHAKAAAREGAGQSRDDQRLADIRARALDHEDAGGHQNSMPSCAFTPAAK